MHNKRIIIGITVALAALAAAGIALNPRDNGTFAGRTLRCAIIPEDFSRQSGRLEVGYNYELLERFTRSLDSQADTRLMHSMPHYVDSLRSGALDIVVIPFQDSLAIDSIFVSVPVDSIAYWLINGESKAQLDEINTWLEEYHASTLCSELHREFLEVPSPGKARDFISPYDSLMREVCEPLGEDWRLLAAISYQESRYRIEARSRRGAAGMMQMMPVTAKHYGVDNIADPRQSLEAGAKYLQHLKKMFHKRAADSESLRHFVLAAYNAGSSRLQDVLNYADSIEADCSTWAALKEIITALDEEVTEGNEDIRHGKFAGRETLAFVESVERRYQHFRQLFK